MCQNKNASHLKCTCGQNVTWHICVCLLCWWRLLPPLQETSIRWMTAVWSTCWRVCVWRTRVSSRLQRNASTKCFPGELQWINLKCRRVIPCSHHFKKTTLSSLVNHLSSVHTETSVCALHVKTRMQFLAAWIKKRRRRLLNFKMSLCYSLNKN